ncbi:hypothetical protein GCM10009716_10270 [Streptomyces sodiiphilus]|uniref:Carrier domain-containing protein n=1 Tax=Streptomyces sodiiphilus TaxID=226217 RepID=A0ABP5A3Z3_9ACTN
MNRRSAEPGSLAGMLGRTARERPEDPAVVHGEVTLSYRQLQEGAAQVALRLRRLGVRADDCVGLYAEPSTDLMTGVWGILLSGGAYLPLSPEYPEERIRYMTEDSRARVIVCQDTFRRRLTSLAPAGTVILSLTDPGTDPPAGCVLPAGEPPRPRRAIHPDDLAYVIYTSGSTGRPKGVMISHRAVVHQLRWLHTEHGLNAEATVVQKTPISFDAAQWEILAPACGSRVVMGGPGMYRDPERLIDTITTHDVTLLQCVPTLLRALLDTERLGACASLRRVFSGGEVLPRDLARRCVEELPGRELVNLYGPTECTINSSAFRVDPAALADEPPSVPIGRPVPGTRYAILDARLRPVRAGETGELYIGGAQLARGYLHRPELTAERFRPVALSPDRGPERMYRTGDLAYGGADGTVHFVGRADNQVKLRGFRVEPDEIALAIENHEWVTRAAVIVREDPRSGSQHLIACAELNSREAALMDQGEHGDHHRSKAGRLQVRAQLSNPGVRTPAELDGRPVIPLPGRTPDAAQRRRVFARKTYRLYDGGPVSRADLLRLLAVPQPARAPRPPQRLTLGRLGRILRWFGRYTSEERLLPKYSYASPGALYATQMLVEIPPEGPLPAGCYYYHPLDHTLVRTGEHTGTPHTGPRIHFAGRRGAIEPVYRDNVREVLEIETGHMVGVFDEILRDHGLAIREVGCFPEVMDALGAAGDDCCLGTFELVPDPGRRPAEPVDLYVQAHPGRIEGLPAGQYHYHDGLLERISDDLVLKKHVVAINQQAYTEASFGITVVSRPQRPWLEYIGLGRVLQRLQFNDLGIGLMSSGYSSKSGRDLPAARRIREILRSRGRDAPASYFFTGGRVSAEQRHSEGMREDAVHMRGPAELIKDDLAAFLPDYMVPNKVVIMDRIPLTANGKTDLRALEESPATAPGTGLRPHVPPRTVAENRTAAVWSAALRYEPVSVRDDFFEAGGNSLTAVLLINRLNREFGSSLPAQIIFECPTVAQLASRIDEVSGASGTSGVLAGITASRLVPLHPGGTGSPVHCWPGLGGYPMGLRPLARDAGLDRPFYGIQAQGINPGEEPSTSVRAMAAADVEAIRAVQPSGPYTLWGYSFGAQVAYEAAHLIECSGERVEQLFLIAPGSPRTGNSASCGRRRASYADPGFLAILFSVFTGTITGPLLAECLTEGTDEASFTAFMSARLPGLDAGLVTRISEVVRRMYEFTYTPDELAERRVQAPVTVFTANGDTRSFLEDHGRYGVPPDVIRLRGGHYDILRLPGLTELARALGAGRTPDTRLRSPAV